MTTPEQFNDSEMEAFFDAEMHKQIDSMRIEHEHSMVADRVWAAVESLDMPLAVSRNPAAHDDDFSALLEEVAEIVDMLPQDNQADSPRDEHIRGIANMIWDEQIMMLEQTSLALDMQLHGDISVSEKVLIKKKLMARIIVKNENQEQWLKLADAVLDGDPLNLNSPEDLTMITEALEIAANLDNTPEVKLYDNVLTLLGVPDLSQDIPEDYDMDQIELLTYAARDITEAALCKAGKLQQPDRHSTVHEVILAYGLTRDVDLSKVFKLIDSYAEMKAPKE
jgi:predicted nucleic acid-binding OB-fold protein